MMTKTETLESIIPLWSQIGAGFAVAPSGITPDLERLLLGTARTVELSPQLLIMAATWLHEYGDLLAKHRLKRLIFAELAPEDWPVLGLLLDSARQSPSGPEFRSLLGPLERPIRADAGARPLFLQDRESRVFSARAERRASAISRRWGLWCEPIEFKFNALRSARWIMEHNPSFISRADFRGDLRASILASLQFEEGAGESELALARACGGSRAQVRAALDNLEMTGRVRRERWKRRTAIVLTSVRDRAA